ncbi:hypothetical protein J6590_096601 [Homalodisca vitripennis]|nr:hypothetical protein J6590_011625 [Homalodisca vitripennis]KAG8284738.1 hypothetical protein J6590_096601 [Homalodisca vitripennis]
MAGDLLCQNTGGEFKRPEQTHIDRSNYLVVRYIFGQNYTDTETSVFPDRVFAPIQHNAPLHFTHQLCPGPDNVDIYVV